MSLIDVTSRDAVLDAVDEFDDLGRDAFLAKYGFMPARSCYLEYTLQRYDGQAILAAAHGFQHGSPLGAGHIGTEAEAKKTLERLDFRVVVDRVLAIDDAWDVAPGDELTRAEISKRFGGALYGGIEPSARTPNVFIFTDLTSGRDHGYTYDRFSETEPGVFFYTGDGQVGDQDPHVGGNKSVVMHFDQARTLRLFEAADGKQRPGGKLQRYIGPFRLDQQNPWRLEESRDKTGKMRKVVVFRLLADD